MAEWYHLARDGEAEDLDVEEQIEARQEHLKAQQEMLKEIFPTPSIIGVGVCTAIAVTRIKPRTGELEEISLSPSVPPMVPFANLPLKRCAMLHILAVFGFAATFAGSLALLAVYRGCEMLRFIFKQEMAQIRELQRQKTTFYTDVIAALEAKENKREIALPQELQPVPGHCGWYVYKAPACTPLWFRRRSHRRGEASGDGNAHDWEWSPDKLVWIDIATTRVPSGYWEGEEPAPSNLVNTVAIIILQAKISLA
eukprot:scaffold24208_cov51-Prasinocladus_malaysianus.AAC.5